MGSNSKTSKQDKSIVNKAGMLQTPVKGTPVQLPDQFESRIITKDLISEIKETTEEIQTLLTAKSKIDVRICEALATLKSQFTAYAQQKKISAKDAEQAFGEFVQTVFNIGDTRANEYIRVTKKKELEGLKLPISNLVELSRLPDESLAEFLEEHPPEELSKYSFRKMQALVRDNNENSRPKINSASGGSKNSNSIPDDSKDNDSAESEDTNETPQAAPSRGLVVTIEDEPLVGTVTSTPDIATAELRVAFESFKETFESGALTSEAESLLQEIQEWNTHLAKNAKGGVK